MEIRITSQDGVHQYDGDGNAITTWNKKKCNWIVNKEFENSQIDWCGEDNDFPGGYTESEYERNYPNWRRVPDIKVAWYWNTKESYKNAFGHPSTFGQSAYYYDKLSYPIVCVREWGDIDEPKETVIGRFKDYAGFYQKCDRVIVYYNDEVLLDETKSKISN